MYPYESVRTKSKKHVKNPKTFVQVTPSWEQQAYGWHIISSINNVGISKKAFKNEPPTTLPQWYLKSLAYDDEQLEFFLQ